MTVKRTESGEIVARMSIRDLAIVVSMFVTLLGFLWNIKVDVAVLRSEVQSHDKELGKHEKRIDRLETVPGR